MKPTTHYHIPSHIYTSHPILSQRTERRRGAAHQKYSFEPSLFSNSRRPQFSFTLPLTPNHPPPTHFLYFLHYSTTKLHQSHKIQRGAQASRAS
ncbi:hypothetical protein RchiOBHm_Chr2g0161041 [Rosa chinensis]|uniref:Uncharacterized protein n=1 Tax=Rosa chinensis TaxID=74649 RepID=A0A2P6S2P6_ROSCH|nr:hypothetical protein RchiOBHm_Chr2g0161041 [Rosa chinensis]